MNNLKTIKLISEGNFSKVFLVSDTKKKKYVLKKYEPKALRQSYLEYLYLNSIDIPNVVKAIDHAIGDDGSSLLLEFIEGESFNFDDFKKFSRYEKRRFFYDLCITLAKVHSAGICVNDIKPENIIVKNKKPFIIDFGLATLNGYSDNFIRGTLAYSAPEKIDRFTNHFAGDVFSVAILFFYSQNGFTPADDIGFDKYRVLLSDEETLEKYLKEKCIDHQIIQMFSPDPSKRQGMLQAASFFYSGKEKRAEITELEIENYVFPSQIEFIKKALDNNSKRFYKYNQYDEINKIAELSGLWCESALRRQVLIDEEVFENDPESFFSGLSETLGRNIMSLQDMSTAINEKFGSLFFFVKRSAGEGGDMPSLLESVKKDDIIYFIKSTSSELPELSKGEILTSAEKLEVELTEECFLSRKPFNVRNKFLSTLRKDKMPGKNPLSDLLEYIGIELPPDLLYDIFGKNTGALLRQAFCYEKAELGINGIRPLSFTDVKPSAAVLKKFKKSIEYRELFLLQALIAERDNKEKSEVLELYEKYIMKLSEKEKYFTAFEFASNLLKRVNISSFSCEFMKRFAFLSRMSAEPELALKIYSDLEKITDGIEKAVIKSDRAVVLQEQLKFDEALTCYDEALMIFEAKQSIKDILRTMNNKGAVLFEMKLFRETEKVFNLLLHKAQQNSMIQFITMSFLNLASVNFSLAEWKKTLHFSKKSLELSEKHKKIRLIMLSLKYQMYASAGLGRFDEVMEIADRIISSTAVKENRKLYSELLCDMLFLSNFSGIDRTLIFNEIENIISEYPIKLNDESLRILFFEHLNKGDVITALKYQKEISGDDDCKMTYTTLQGDQRSILEMIDKMSAAGYGWDLLFYSSQLMLNPIFSNDQELKKQISSINEMFPFVPLSKIFSKYADNTKIEGNDGDIWKTLSYIHSSLDFNETLMAVLISMINTANLERAIFFRFREGKYLPVKAVDGELKETDISGIKISTTILRDTVKYGDIRFLTGLQEETVFDIHSSIFGLGLKSAVCSPLIINGSLKGVFYADTRSDRKFSEDEKKKIETVLIQAASALKNSDEFEKVKENANVISDSQEGFGGMIGSCRKIRDIFDVINTAGKHNVNVLITGPTGSGKELIARSLHRVYGKEKPMVSLNCTAIPETLMESELFGYVKGAFTGADKDKKGSIEAAGDGTLFLDEIGDMPLSLQAKLLRVLQERVFSPVGSSKEKKVGARFIAATNKNLDDLVKGRLFREDLLYRLNVVEIKVPPLSERREDIPVIALYFLKRFNEKYGKSVKGLSADFVKMLKKRDWPGNIRQLENLIEKTVLFADGDEIHLGLLEGIEDSNSASVMDNIPENWEEHKKFRSRLINELDKKFAEKFVNNSGGSLKRASEAAGMNRRQMYRILNDENVS